MKLFKKLLFVLALVVIMLPIKTYAANQVNLYLFYNITCPHCEAEREMLKDLQSEFPNLKIYQYELTTSSANRKLYYRTSEVLKQNVTSVPYTIIGTKSYVGYSEAMSKAEFEKVIRVYSNAVSYSDPIGKMLGVAASNGTLTYEDLAGEDKTNYVIDIPFVGKTEAKNLSLPILSIVIGTLDGINPCAMWVLLFLISSLIGMKDRKRMWVLGSTFIITSALIYLVFMLAWLNLAIFIGAVWWVKLLIAVVALTGGYLNLRAYARTKENGCEVVDEKKRKKIFAKVRDFTSEKKYPLAILGVMTLAVSVNFVELMCSAGLPVIFTNILALNKLSILEYAFYVFLYLLFFILDDLIVFFVAMTTLQLKGISNKFGKWSHLIGGLIMILIGLLMIFKPEWLMLNF